ncbi:MAG: YicC family protein [Bacteroidales bacterium]|nr:YicC family protein [Bacteroidales bacterium]
MKSMTGYGKAAKDFENKTINVEIRTLNSKQADINIRLPNIYRQCEIELNNLIKQELQRGKIDCYITLAYQKGAAVLDIDKDLFKDYYRQLSEMTDEVDADDDYLTEFLLSRDDVNQPESAEISDKERQALTECTLQALQQVNLYRQTEGAALEKAFVNHLCVIEDLAKQAEPFEKDRVPKIKEKFLQRFKELNVEGVNPERLEQELIFYLEKLDITEERIRLNQHIGYFRQCMQNEEVLGKKIGFIAQEMGREINTLGSKSNDAAMQRIVVLMKDELEKIKEQSANVL